MAAAFVVAATANGAGYRFGASDQAFYLPVVVRALDATAFPRDGVLIDAQGRLMLYDEALAGLVSLTGWSLETIFFGAYVTSLLVVWVGLTALGRHVYANTWATTALVAAYSLRHRITKTSANSLEPYFHPRILAFGLGATALAALLRRRIWTAVTLVGLAALVHVTTALWFAVLVGTAVLVLDARWRARTAPALVASLALGGWALGGRILAGRFDVMDAVWLQAVASKDSLFATDWPLSAWAANLGLLAGLWTAHWWRRSRGDATPEDAALVWGATALVALFLAALPLVAARVAFFVQLQMPRVFWLVDLVATVYAVGALAGRRSARTAPAVALACVLALVAAGRGWYVMRVERPDRALVATQLPQDSWHDATAWIARQGPGVHVLADPGHGWKYGTSVRVSARRDVVLEEVKDSALAIYSRDVAARVVERTHAIGDFATLTPERARALASTYGVDLLITTADLELPERYRNDTFRVYALRP